MRNIEKYCEETLEEFTPCYDISEDLKQSFITIIKYLNEFPENLSIRSKKNAPDVSSQKGITDLALTYFDSFYTKTIPEEPHTVPDEMVSLIMQKAFNHSKTEIEIIKTTHKQSMACENAVGTLLERYLASVLIPCGWAWCCGDFVKAIDFIKFENGKWYELQIKNRDNSENSSSSKIRKNTQIHKWHRTASKTGKTRWDKLPEPMQGLNLSEEGFKNFVEKYLDENKNLGKGN